MVKFAPDGTAYDLIGPDGAPCVVLIHGLGLSRGLWKAHLPAFADKRVLLYDLFGHGESAPPPEALSLSVFSDQLARLLAHVGIAQAHIVGFSIGGMINRRFALDYPAMVSSLVILNSPHDRGPDAQAAVESRAKAAHDQGAFATFDEALKRWFTTRYLENDNETDRVRHWRSQADSDGYAQTAWVLAHGVRELIAPDPAVTAPALIVTCENDIGSTPKMSHDIAAEIDGSQVIIVPRLKHLGLMENPGTFTAAILDFVEAV